MKKVNTTYVPIIILWACLAISCMGSKQNKEVELSSPDGNYTLFFQINEASGPMYKVNFKRQEIVGKSNLGFDFPDKTESVKDIGIDYVENASVNTNWKPVYGEKSEYPEKYVESLVVLKGKDARYNLRIRAYNEGVAFRYEFKGEPNEIHIKREKTEFSLPPDALAWASLRAQSEIVKMPVADIKEAVERPLLVQLPDSVFLALGEADLVDYARMKFMGKKGSPGTLVSDLSSKVEGNLPFKTPWRFIMAADRPGKLLENNYLLLNLNDPDKITDTSWIKPGKVIRESTLTTVGGIACVDFAEKHNLQFIEFDAGWYGDEYDDSSDATTITVDPKRSKGPLDLLRVIDYAKSKDIGVILYVNRRAMEQQLDDILPLLRTWGVSGIKYGFVRVGPQKWTRWLHDAVRKAADHHLMIDIHDEYRPTGYSRTYPNLMTQEGIRGDEESPGNAMVLNTIFTRMIAGAGDQTNCYFALRVAEKMGSHVSQLAKAVCIYSPWQFLYWYDRPEGSKPENEGAGGSKEFIQEVPELAFYDALPTVWDDTKVLGGYPGKYAVLARRSGNDWFVGALTGNKAHQLEIPLGFLNSGTTYEATIYSDDAEMNTLTKVKIEKQKVTSRDIFNYNVKMQNGLAIHLKAL